MDIDEGALQRLRVTGLRYMDSLIEDTIDEAFRCGSPVEQAFAVAAIILMRTAYYEFDWMHHDGDMTIEHLVADATLLGDARTPVDQQSTRWGVLAPQVMIGPYRCGFALAWRFGLHDVATAVIECADDDPDRDRFVQTQGHRLFRLLSRDVWRDPFSAAQNVFDVVFEQARASVAAAHHYDLGHPGVAQTELSRINLTLAK